MFPDFNVAKIFVPHIWFRIADTCFHLHSNRKYAKSNVNSNFQKAAKFWLIRKFCENFPSGNASVLLWWLYYETNNYILVRKKVLRSDLCLFNEVSLRSALHHVRDRNCAQNEMLLHTALVPTTAVNRIVTSPPLPLDITSEQRIM